MNKKASDLIVEVELVIGAWASWKKVDCSGELKES